MTTPITRADRDAHRRYSRCLGEIRAGYRNLLMAQNAGETYVARSEMQEAAKRLDKITLPEPWKSWCHLGNALYPRRRNPASGATQKG